jgi:hypothetical protein
VKCAQERLRSACACGVPSAVACCAVQTRHTQIRNNTCSGVTVRVPHLPRQHSNREHYTLPFLRSKRVRYPRVSTQSAGDHACCRQRCSAGDSAYPAVQVGTTLEAPVRAAMWRNDGEVCVNSGKSHDQCRVGHCIGAWQQHTAEQGMQKRQQCCGSRNVIEVFIQSILIIYSYSLATSGRTHTKKAGLGARPANCWAPDRWMLLLLHQCCDTIVADASNTSLMTDSVS